MATEIVSLAATRFQLRLIGLILFAFGGLAFVSILTLYACRLVLYPAAVGAEISSPNTAFGFFAFVAAAAVLGETLSDLHVWQLGVPLFLAAGLSWLVLTYAIPARLIVLKQKGELGEVVSGDWLLWVVATQSIAIVAATLALRGSAFLPFLSVVGVWAWSVGVLLYLILVTILVVRLFTVRLDPAELSASYWISMGATAITTLAGARIMSLPHSLPILISALPLISGISLVFWCFGTWWIPLLLVLGAWRHWHQRYPIAYDREFWSIVFPLGMYATASAEFGTAAKLPFMIQIGSWEFWLALLAWLLLTGGLLATGVRSLVLWRGPDSVAPAAADAKLRQQPAREHGGNAEAEGPLMEAPG